MQDREVTRNPGENDLLRNVATNMDRNGSPAYLRASQSQYLCPQETSGSTTSITRPTMCETSGSGTSADRCSNDQEPVQRHLSSSRSGDSHSPRSSVVDNLMASSRNGIETDSPCVTVKLEVVDDENSSCSTNKDCSSNSVSGTVPPMGHQREVCPMSLPDSHDVVISTDFDSRGSLHLGSRANTATGRDEQFEGTNAEEQQSMKTLQCMFASLIGSNAEDLFEHGNDGDEDELTKEQPSSFRVGNATQERHLDSHSPHSLEHKTNTTKGLHVEQPSKSIDQRRHRIMQHKRNKKLTVDVAGFANPRDMSRFLVIGSGCSAENSARPWTNPLSHPEDYNIREILESHMKGRPVLQELNNAKMPSIKNRRLLVQILVSYLVEHGGRNLYPTAEQKTALAKAVVTQFPCMKDNLPGAEGYEYLYHKGQGFVEFRLKNLRATVASHRRCSSGAKRVHEPHVQEHGNISNTSNPEEEAVELLQSSEDVLEKVKWLQCNHPTPENRDQLLNFFRQTHSHRAARIKREHLSIKDVLHLYPCFKEMPSLIDYEFALEHEGKEDAFLATWHIKYFSQIMALGKRHNDGALIHIIDEFGETGDPDLCALYLLSHLMPSSNWHAYQKSKKGWKKPAASRSEAVTRLFQHKPLGTDVAEYAKSKPAELTQPFLLCLGPNTAPTQYYLILDSEALPAGDSTVAAFDRLFKAHVTFNVPFDPCLHFFFSFFSAVIYKCCSEEMTPQIRAFHILLNSTSEDDG